jgi:hypothetical protein
MTAPTIFGRPMTCVRAGSGPVPCPIWSLDIGPWRATVRGGWGRWGIRGASGVEVGSVQSVVHDTDAEAAAALESWLRTVHSETDAELTRAGT